MCEMKERYTAFMEYMVQQGYACIIHDHRGHENSVKEKKHLGYMYGGGAEALVEDLHQITMQAKERWTQAPLILLGHSMGSMVARVFIKKYDGELQALIICERRGTVISVENYIRVCATRYCRRRLNMKCMRI